MNHVKYLATGSLLAGLCAGALGQSNYDSEASWGGGTAGSYGVGNYSTFGQSFNAPTGGYNTLDDFSFWLAGVNLTTDTFAAESDTFSAQVYQWNGTSTIGSALFTENLGLLTLGPSFTQVEATGNVTMTPGDQYVALLTDTSLNSYFNFTWLPSGVAGDGGGNWVFGNGTTMFNDTGDLGWHADFSGAPEPLGSTLLGAGCLGLFLRRRMKSRN